MSSLIKDLFYFPSYGYGAFVVWRRNYLYFRYTLFAALSWIFLEPLLYLVALGFGLGTFVTEINGQSYAQFIAPALMGITAMFVGFFEGSYGTYTKLTRQNTLHTIIVAPISPDEVTIGEIAWATTKAFLSVLAVTVVTVSLGLVSFTHLGLALIFLLITCWVFAAFGVVLATAAKSYDWFIYYQSGLITPMSLFCGTYFPLDQYPTAVKSIAYLLPLTHTLEAIRAIFKGDYYPHLILNFIVLAFLGVFLTHVASARMKRKLIL